MDVKHCKLSFKRKLFRSHDIQHDGKSKIVFHILSICIKNPRRLFFLVATMLCCSTATIAGNKLNCFVFSEMLTSIFFSSLESTIFLHL
ncbi:unnamed protein product [Triticum turgidum subsp. durum]|uniref:Uncharacterized protein n=1 Tax=Triticum turgidum subsp. durum TaxID=4567 RepID=A0A9R1BWV1_TRITD|nr:unnamed protein product [Triticum turgidum subsp. durum]